MIDGTTLSAILFVTAQGALGLYLLRRRARKRRVAESYRTVLNDVLASGVPDNGRSRSGFRLPEGRPRTFPAPIPVANSWFDLTVPNGSPAPALVAAERIRNKLRSSL
jgi:hypothetical protein